MLTQPHTFIVIHNPNNMGAPSDAPSMPNPSALQTLLRSHQAPPSSPHPPHLHHLALQIAHNLRYQHNWTDVRLHYDSGSSKQALPRPMISGLPPQRLYIHPDEQIELLQAQKAAGKTGMPELSTEREWVLPSHLREKWSLRRFGEVFDRVEVVPGASDGEEIFEDDHQDEDDEETKVNKWRTSQPKRLLLATLDDDSTVVYYVIHDGIIKPRQN